MRARHEVSLLAVTLITGVVEIVAGIVDEAVVFDIADNADDFGRMSGVVCRTRNLALGRRLQ